MNPLGLYCIMHQTCYSRALLTDPEQPAFLGVVLHDEALQTLCNCMISEFFYAELLRGVNLATRVQDVE